MVAVGKMQAKTLVRYRGHQVFLRGSRHVPPQADVVNAAMNTLMDLVAGELEHCARAVLGHWLFGFIHPFGDGNGRTARLAMNVLLAGGGYRWTVVRVEDRADTLGSLETASVERDIRPFARFVAERVRWSLDNRPGGEPPRPSGPSV
jgi:Fic family protein